MTMYILLKSKVGSYTYLDLERQFCNVQFQKCREIIITSTVYMLLKSRLRFHFQTETSFPDWDFISTQSYEDMAMKESNNMLWTVQLNLY
jgi:hypothetical protein